MVGTEGSSVVQFTSVNRPMRAFAVARDTAAPMCTRGKSSDKYHDNRLFLELNYFGSRVKILVTDGLLTGFIHSLSRF